MSSASHDPARHRPRPARMQAFTNPRGFADVTLRDGAVDAIDVLSGIPDPGTLPTDALAEATARVLARPGVPALQYSRTAGIPALREWIAARENVDVSRVIITNGGFHGLALAIESVVERGDLVAIDNPVFPLFLRGLELADARILPVRVGAAGLDIDHLTQVLSDGARPAALYTVPEFHNPAQSTLPTAQRRELVALAEKYNFVVFADDPYRELRFAGEAQSAEPFHNSDHVIHINTFTKTLGPGLRLGWLVLPESLVPDIVALRSRQDSHSSTFVQAVVADLLTSDPGLFDATLERARPIYRSRAQALSEALEAEAPGAFEVAVPEGGLFLWPRLADDRIDAERLADDAAAEGVLYQRGSYFVSGPGSDADRHLRLAFGDTAEVRLVEAARRLGRAVARQK